MFSAQEWNDLNGALRDRTNVDRAVRAAETIHRTATGDDLPRLMEMLTDDDFFVRETAAWPISELVGPAALPELLVAFQRGFDEGHDNDGFQAVLADMVQLNETSARDVLTRLAKSDNPSIRENAAWLLEFCGKQRNP